MRPEVAAGDSNYTWYANANKDSVSMVDEAVRSSPAAYPTEESVQDMYTLKPLPQKLERTRTRTWTAVKSGQ